MVCSVSTNVNDEDSGSKESIIYLLPTAANKPPTGNPNRGSSSEGLGVKLIAEIKNAMYIPMNIFMNKPHALRCMFISILNCENNDDSFPSRASPNPVS